MNELFLSKTELFCGITPEETEMMVNCLEARTRTYDKGESIYRSGDRIEAMGLVLWGSVNILQNSIWGHQNIIGHAGAGEVFAETYACIPDERSMADVVAAEKTEILFLNIEKVMRTCPSACRFHSRLIRNLLSVMASKNLNLTRKISHISPKSIRDRLMSYLSQQAVKQGGFQFEIPFNRQELADYLCVDRSAMSNELSKMRKEGLLSYHKNKFRLEEKERQI